uniref:Uncharacterized protein n=1 Tax=Anopheles coluzzii TaxID=1518534 RepID=A0A6E8W9Y6_ANOCL
PLDVKKSAGKPHPVTQTQQTIFLKTAGATPSTSKPVQQPLDVKKSAGKPHPVTQTQQTIFLKTAGATPSKFYFNQFRTLCNDHILSA